VCFVEFLLRLLSQTTGSLFSVFFVFGKAFKKWIWDFVVLMHSKCIFIEMTHLMMKHLENSLNISHGKFFILKNQQIHLINFWPRNNQFKKGLEGWSFLTICTKYAILINKKNWIFLVPTIIVFEDLEPRFFKKSNNNPTSFFLW
jgi:hypothetical protein